MEERAIEKGAEHVSGNVGAVPADPPAKPSILQQILHQHAEDPSRVAGVWAELEPLRRIAESGHYNLAPASDQLAEEAKVAITKALGHTVTKVLFVSRADRASHPVDIHYSWYEATQTCVRFCEDFYVPVEETLQEEITGPLFLLLDSSFVPSDTDKTVASDSLELVPFRGNHPCHHGVWDGLTLIPLMLAGSLFDTRNLVLMTLCLTPFIRLLTKAVPLGQKIGEDGTWYVLVA